MIHGQTRRGARSWAMRMRGAAAARGGSGLCIAQGEVARAEACASRTVYFARSCTKPLEGEGVGAAGMLEKECSEGTRVARVLRCCCPHRARPQQRALSSAGHTPRDCQPLAAPAGTVVSWGVFWLPGPLARALPDVRQGDHCRADCHGKEQHRGAPEHAHLRGADGATERLSRGAVTNDRMRGHWRADGDRHA